MLASEINNLAGSWSSLKFATDSPHWVPAIQSDLASLKSNPFYFSNIIGGTLLEKCWKSLLFVQTDILHKNIQRNFTQTLCGRLKGPTDVDRFLFIYLFLYFGALVAWQFCTVQYCTVLHSTLLWRFGGPAHLLVGTEFSWLPELLHSHGVHGSKVGLHRLNTAGRVANTVVLLQVQGVLS